MNEDVASGSRLWPLRVVLHDDGEDTEIIIAAHALGALPVELGIGGRNDVVVVAGAWRRAGGLRTVGREPEQTRTLSSSATNLVVCKEW